MTFKNAEASCLAHKRVLHQLLLHKRGKVLYLEVRAWAFFFPIMMWLLAQAAEIAIRAQLQQLPFRAV